MSLDNQVVLDCRDLLARMETRERGVYQVIKEHRDQGALRARVEGEDQSDHLDHQAVKETSDDLVYPAIKVHQEARALLVCQEQPESKDHLELMALPGRKVPGDEMGMMEGQENVGQMGQGGQLDDQEYKGL